MNVFFSVKVLEGKETAKYGEPASRPLPGFGGGAAESRLDVVAQDGGPIGGGSKFWFVFLVGMARVFFGGGKVFKNCW